MIELISWLLKIEERAAGNYLALSSQLKDTDPEFSDFLARLSVEEQNHLGLMQCATDYVHRADALKQPLISLDQDTKDRIENALDAMGSMIQAGETRRARIIERIIDAEFSEWNDLFLYVARSICMQEQSLRHAASSIQEHIRSIESFVASDPSLRPQMERLRMHPAAWLKRILVVEDSDIVFNLLKALLQDLGIIETAVNGREALNKIKSFHYHVIISDIKMPVMDGIQFFNEAVKLQPDIGSRMIFFTGIPSSEIGDFLAANNLRYFVKPTGVQSIKNAVREIISSERK